MNVTVPEVRVAIPRELRSFCAAQPADRNAAQPAGRNTSQFAAKNTSPSRQAELRMPAYSVRELLAELARRYPQVYVRVCDERGEPRPHINVFVNDDHVRARAGLDTPLAANDLVTILPAVSGG